MKKVIRNVGVLDLRSATEQSIGEIERVDNVGAVIYSKETAHLLTRLSIRNMGSSMEVPADCKLVTGQLEINSGYVDQLKEPLSLFMTGQMMIKNDLTADALDKGIKALLITGQVFCPEKLLPTLQSKIVSLTGQIMSYPDNAKIMVGKLKIDDHFLNSLDDNTTIFMTGKLDLTAEFEVALFERKIEKFHLVGKAILRDEYAEIFNRRLLSQTACKLEVLPKGYLYLPEEFKLDNLNIKRFQKASLYCPSGVVIDAGITSGSLLSAILSLKTKHVVCHRELKEFISELCFDPATLILPYQGRLVTVEDEYLLTSEELEYSKEITTFLVRGELEIDSEVKPETIAAKVEFFDNFGEINAFRQQFGVIQSKIRTRKGELNCKDKDDKQDENSIGNAGYLKI
ncbi:MAG: hypothetical protein PHW04_18645 [Candidatus Wallbacteria bacterium]|nr:hypothetical protein [Candidatus Wallbacteria bacterium]